MEKFQGFQLEQTGIRAGAKLTFLYDESITAKVVKNGRIIFERKTLSLTGASWNTKGIRCLSAKRLRKFSPTFTTSRRSLARGYWMYQGRTPH